MGLLFMVFHRFLPSKGRVIKYLLQGGGGYTALSKKNFIAPTKRDRKIPWPIVKRPIFFVAHAKISWFTFQRFDSIK